MVAATETSPTSVRVNRVIEIEAPVAIAFDALLEQLGPECEMSSGHPMPMKFEPWPGGRWFRDLGNDAGHWWGTVQVIKPPTLIEIHGPLFMSYPAISHIQYRLAENNEFTSLSFVHRAFGEIDPDHMDGVNAGWDYHLDQIKSRSHQLR